MASLITIIRPLSATAQDSLPGQLAQCMSILTSEQFFQNCLQLLTPPFNGVVAVFDDYQQLKVGMVRKFFAVKERVETPRPDTFWISFYFKGKGAIGVETSRDFSRDPSEVQQSRSQL